MVNFGETFGKWLQKIGITVLFCLFVLGFICCCYIPILRSVIFSKIPTQITVLAKPNPASDLYPIPLFLDDPTKTQDGEFWTSLTNMANFTLSTEIGRDVRKLAKPHWDIWESLFGTNIDLRLMAGEYTNLPCQFLVAITQTLQSCNQDLM